MSTQPDQLPDRQSEGEFASIVESIRQGVSSGRQYTGQMPFGTN
jgi:hypothetical protein